MRNFHQDIQPIAWVALILSLLIICALSKLRAQAVSDSPPASDPKATAIIEEAITALGGKAAWQAVGGVTAQAVITSTIRPQQTVNWTDDWSTGRVRFRRDTAKSDASPSSLIGTDAPESHVRPNGAIEYILHDNGVAVLALGYPGAALAVSVGKYGCSFQFGHPVDPRVPVPASDPETVAIAEECPDPYYPAGLAHFYWVFSRSTGLPASVELPVQGNTHHTVLWQKVTFITFESIEGLLVPQQVEITRTTGWVDRLTISKTTFVSSFPDSTFQTGR